MSERVFDLKTGGPGDSASDHRPGCRSQGLARGFQTQSRPSPPQARPQRARAGAATQRLPLAPREAGCREHSDAGVEAASPRPGWGPGPSTSSLTGWGRLGGALTRPEGLLGGGRGLSLPALDLGRLALPSRAREDSRERASAALSAKVSALFV